MLSLVQLGLLGAHVFQRTDELPELREHRLVCQLLTGSFGDAEIDDLGNGLLIVFGDKHIRWLDVAMDDRFLVRVLNSV